MSAGEEYQKWWDEADRKRANGEDVDWDTEPESPGFTLEDMAYNITCYCKDLNLTPLDMKRIFNAGLVNVQGKTRAKVTQRITPKSSEPA